MGNALASKRLGEIKFESLVSLPGFGFLVLQVTKVRSDKIMLKLCPLASDSQPSQHHFEASLEVDLKLCLAPSARAITQVTSSHLPPPGLAEMIAEYLCAPAKLPLVIECKRLILKTPGPRNRANAHYIDAYPRGNRSSRYGARTHVAVQWGGFDSWTRQTEYHSEASLALAVSLPDKQAKEAAKQARRDASGEASGVEAHKASMVNARRLKAATGSVSSAASSSLGAGLRGAVISLTRSFLPWRAGAKEAEEEKEAEYEIHDLFGVPVGGLLDLEFPGLLQHHMDSCGLSRAVEAAASSLVRIAEASAEERAPPGGLENDNLRTSEEVERNGHRVESRGSRSPGRRLRVVFRRVS